MDSQDRRSICMVVAGVTWTSALALGIMGTTAGNIRLLFWGGFAALVACIITNHIVVELSIRHERLRVEHLIEGLIAAARQKADVTKIR